MSRLRMITIAAVLASMLGACAQMPSSTAPAGTEPMAAMNSHMKSMREMHDKMSHARTPEERQALMAEHMHMMEMHMEMMHSMMQMMMDRMAPPPAAK